MKKLVPIILLIAMLASCEKEVEFKGKYQKPKLVLNAIMQVDSLVTAEFTRSQFFTYATWESEDYYIGVCDPHLYITVNGTYTEELTTEDRHLYVSTYRVKEGDIIEFKGTARGFDDIKATSYPVVGAPVCEITEAYYIVTDSTMYSHDSVEGGYIFYDAQLDLKIKITDKEPKILNLYHLNLKGDVIYYHADSIEQRILSMMYDYTDPIFNNTSSSTLLGDLMWSYPRQIFSDQLFDGDSYTIKTNNKDEIRFGQYYNVKNDVNIRVHLTQLDEAYYRYLETRNRYSETEDSFFTEPVQIYSNVENGLGVVGSMYKTVISAKLQRKK